MRYRLLLLLLIVFYQSLSAQKQGQALIDSLMSDKSMLKEDTNKAKTLLKLEQTWLFIDPVTGIGVANRGLALSEKLGWKRGIANFHNDLGLAIGDTGNNSLARQHFQQSLALNTEMNAGTKIITNLNNIARSYQQQSDFAQALDYGLRALKMAQDMKNDEQISLVGTVLSSAALAQADYGKAREYANMTVEAGRRAHAMRNVGTALIHLGSISAATQDTAAGRKYYDQALEVYTNLGNLVVIANILDIRSELYMDSLPKVLADLQRALKILETAGARGLYMMNTLGDLGIVYSSLGRGEKNPVIKQNDFDKARDYFDRALDLAKENRVVEYTSSMYLKLSELEQLRGQYKAALEHHQQFFHLNDSLFSQEKKNQLAALQSRQRLELKDQEIALSRLEVSTQRKTQLALVAGLVLLALIGALLFWQSRLRKQSNRTLMVLNGQLDEANKVKTRFFGILSHDLRSPIANLVNFLHLTRNEPGLLTEAEQTGYKQEIGEVAAGLLETMETMLLWSKEQMENFRPVHKLVTVDALFEYLEKFFGQPAGVTLVFSNPDALSVSTDENYLKVIMQNLTSNAIKALKGNPDGVIEWIATRKGDKTILSIKDNGPGISEEQVRSLYSETTTANSPTGFGFHLIRDLARAIRYNINIESKPGAGTTFILSA